MTGPECRVQEWQGKVYVHVGEITQGLRLIIGHDEPEKLTPAQTMVLGMRIMQAAVDAERHHTAEAIRAMARGSD